MALSSLLNKQYKEAIRFVLKVKLFNSIKHFKNVRYPFVNVQDIMEKNALCHTETLSYLKHIQESLQEFRQEIKEIRLVIATQKNLSLPEENDEGDDEGDVLYSGFLAPDFHKPRRISTASNPTTPDESSADEQVMSGDETLKVITVND